MVTLDVLVAVYLFVELGHALPRGRQELQHGGTGPAARATGDHDFFKALSQRYFDPRHSACYDRRLNSVTTNLCIISFIEG